MNHKTKFAIGLASALVLVGFSPVWAQKVETKNVTINGEIVAIDLKEKTITVKVTEGSGAGRERTFDVPANTKIEKDNKINQRLKDLKEGDKVNLTYRKGKELGPDHKTQVEVMKTIKILVLSSAEPGTPATPAAP